MTIDSVNLTYDALGRMVEQNRSGAYTQFVYSPTGFKMQIMNGQAPPIKSLVPLPGGGVAVFSASGENFYHPDHLGSSRFISTSNRTMYYDGAFAPFGEPYAQSGTADLSFTGQRQDTVAGLYDFPAREYSIQGRWPSPDPAGLAAVDPSNPQSWNRYAYVLNNPLRLTDPTGLMCQYLSDDGSSTESIDYVSDPAACRFSGGEWISESGGSTFAGTPSGEGACFIVNGTPGGCGNTDYGSLPPLTNPAYGNPSQGGGTIGASIGGTNRISIWDFFTVPWSGTVLFPLVPFGPVASGGVGPTVAYNLKTDTGCYGLAVGAMVPAGGRAVAAGPLTVGNLGNADNILAGGSVFAGAQSPNPAIGVQAMGNSSGLLAGATFGSMGATTGVSVSKCQGGVGKKLLNLLIDSIL